MKKQVTAFVVLLAVAAAMAQAPVASNYPPVDSNKVVAQNQSVKKITNVKPKTTTNWSKIKDLFM
jgi:hypothetical protein